MKCLIVFIPLLIFFISPVYGAATYIGSSPDDDSFRTTSVTCSVMATGLTAGSTFFFYHSNNLQFTSSSTVTLTSGTDYTLYTTSAVISYTYTQFNEGNDNWYRWGYKQGATLDLSNPYTVKVIPNEAPVITIVQPDHNGFAGKNTYFEINLSDEGEGIDESSISFSLSDAAGTSVFSSGNITYNFNASTGKLAFSSPRQLSSGSRYTLTISVSDRGYRAPYALTATKTVTFNVRTDAIADLVPVPSPFDPGKEACTIQYTLNAPSQNVEINIYDMSYRLVRNIMRNMSRPAGENTLDTWDGKDFAGQNLANGVYFIEIATDADKRYSSVILMRK